MKNTEREIIQLIPGFDFRCQQARYTNFDSNSEPPKANSTEYSLRFQLWSSKLGEMTLTSYEVFMKFVRCLELTNDSTAAARVDASEVLSRECFETWLCTRKSAVKHPERTFHRILLCHIRGSDTRKPFPPEVEKAIIALLNSEEACAIWDRCFKGNLLKVGKHGFRGLGYHEKLAASTNFDGGESHFLNSSEKNSFEFDPDHQGLHLSSYRDNSRYQELKHGGQYQNDIYRNSKSRLTLPPSNHSMIKSRFEEPVANPNEARNNGTSYKDYDDLNSHQIQGQMERPLSPLRRTWRSLLLTPIADEPDRLTREVHTCQTPWERLCEAAERMHISVESEQDVDPLVVDFIKRKVAFKLGSNSNQLVLPNNDVTTKSRFDESIANKFWTNMFPPAVAYMLQQHIPDEYDKRFDPSFIYPNPDQCSFNENKPIGWCRSDYSTGLIVEISEEAKVIMRGDYSGLFMYSSLASLFNFWYCCSLKLPRNNDWIRRLLFRRDGTIGLFLLKINIFPDHHSRVIHFQDISDEHPDVLNKPFLI